MASLIPKTRKTGRKSSLVKPTARKLVYEATQDHNIANGRSNMAQRLIDKIKASIANLNKPNPDAPGVLSTIVDTMKWGDPSVNTLGSQVAVMLSGGRRATVHLAVMVYTLQLLDNGSVGLWMGYGAPPIKPLRLFSTVRQAQGWVDSQTQKIG